MKTKINILAILLVLISSISIHAQEEEAAQLILNYEKLQQLEEILDNMYRGYKILSKGYNAIKNIAEGNYSLHQAFLDGLFLVNPTIRNYQRIPYILQYQKFINKEYKRAFEQFRHDPNLTYSEVVYLQNVYAYLVKASLRNIEELTLVITSTKLRMSDEERLQAIDRIYYDMESKIVFLKVFNNNTQVMSMQRSRQQRELNTLHKLFNVTP